MKGLIFVFLFAPISALFFPNMDMISKAIKDGDATALSTYFDSDVEIAILNEVDIYSKTEAKKVLKTFFTKHHPVSYSQVHQGTSKGQGGQYCIGNMKSAKGKFRVYVYVKKSGSAFVIQELRFEKQ